jgi:ectoine hydroxylase-related dioxygenase (phytanoyl-CoA dioxygenase family)
VAHQGAGDEYGAVHSPPPAEVVAVPLAAGDALVFHGELLHATPANQTDQRRRALQYHYAAPDCRRLRDDYPFRLPAPEQIIQA